MIRSEIENVAEKMASTVHAVCVNVDMRQDIAEKYDIMAVPTLLFFKDGKPLRRIIGYTSQEEIEKFLESVSYTTEEKTTKKDSQYS